MNRMPRDEPRVAREPEQAHHCVNHLVAGQLAVLLVNLLRDLLQ
jgi:hypothetical protein